MEKLVTHSSPACDLQAFSCVLQTAHYSFLSHWETHRKCSQCCSISSYHSFWFCGSFGMESLSLGTKLAFKLLKLDSMFFLYSANGGPAWFTDCWESKRHENNVKKMPYAHIKFENYLCVSPVQWWPLASILTHGLGEKPLNILQQTYRTCMSITMWVESMLTKDHVHKEQPL